MSANNVELLKYTNNINYLTTVYTEKVLLNNYNTISIIAYSDVMLVIEIQFSGNGTNWDYVVPNRINANTGSNISSAVVGKWVRLSIYNPTFSNSTTLRVFAYGSFYSNQVQIRNLGNYDTTVSVSNIPVTAFGELRSARIQPEAQYVFVKGISGTINPKAWILPYSDIKAYSSSATDSLTFTGGNMIFGSGISNAGEISMISGATFRYRAGQGINARFTAYFSQTNLPNIMSEHVGIGNTNVANTNIKDGYFFGYRNGSTYFGIIYIRNTVVTFIPRTSWNVDKCDGSYILPPIDFSTMNVFEISFQYLGYGIVKFFIEDPNTGDLKLVHAINRVNTAGPILTNLNDPTVGLLLYAERPLATTGSGSLGTASYNITLEGDSLTPAERIAVESTKTSVSAEAHIISCRCDTSFYGSINYYPLDMDFLSVSVDGTKTAIIRVYRNSTLSGMVWTAADQYLIPVSYSTAGSISVKGTLIFSFTLAKVDNAQMFLDNFHSHLQPGDIYSITCQSAANTDISLGASFHIH